MHNPNVRIDSDKKKVHERSAPVALTSPRFIPTSIIAGDPAAVEYTTLYRDGLKEDTDCGSKYSLVGKVKLTRGHGGWRM